MARKLFAFVVGPLERTQRNGSIYYVTEIYAGKEGTRVTHWWSGAHFDAEKVAAWRQGTIERLTERLGKGPRIGKGAETEFGLSGAAELSRAASSITGTSLALACARAPARGRKGGRS